MTQAVIKKLLNRWNSTKRNC